MPSKETEKREAYQLKLDMLREETANFPDRLRAIANEINKLREVQPEIVQKAEEELFKGNLGSVKNLLLKFRRKEEIEKLQINWG